MGETRVAADLRFMREVNNTAILEHLRERDRLSVAELAAAAGLSRQAVSRSLAELRTAGLAEMLPPERAGQRSGRPAQLVRFRAEAGHVLGVLVEPAGIRVAIADLSGSVVVSRAEPLGAAAAARDATGVVELLVDQVTAAITEAGLGAADVLVAVAGVPGIVDPAAGSIRLTASMPGLGGDRLLRALQGCLDCTIHLDNDVKLATLGEQWRGVRRDDASLVVVHWGQRIGAGVLIDGVLYRGANNDAGDLGFLDLIVDDTQVGTNPELGRFEEWAGLSALVRLTAEELAAAGEHDERGRLLEAGEQAVELVVDGTRSGRAPYLAALGTIAERFGAGLVAIRALLDPHLVVLTGPVARTGEPLLRALDAAFADHPLQFPELRLSTLGGDAVVQGAIRYALDELERNHYAPIEQRRSTPAGD